MASEKELAENCDNCAICWEKMENARKLPCSHLFHASCLQSWLEQDTSCPTCRLGLNLSPPPDGSAAGSAPTAAAGGDVGPMGSPTGPVATFTRGRGGQPNHFFHFDGSRYVSWLPSFSVEVTHHAGGEVGAGNVGAGAVQQTSQLDAMARQVQQLFPQVSIQVILDDLRVTRSIELTVENVLEGRLISRVTPPPPDPPTVPSPPTAVAQSAARWSVPPTPPIEEDSSATLGSRFSKSPTERERILQRRKELMLHQARKKFLEKHQTS